MCSTHLSPALLYFVVFPWLCVEGPSAQLLSSLLLGKLLAVGRMWQWRLGAACRLGPCQEACGGNSGVQVWLMVVGLA